MFKHWSFFYIQMLNIHEDFATNFFTQETHHKNNLIIFQNSLRIFATFLINTKS